ncbi:MAG: response regulator [Rhodocyclaceae bacterium]
MEHLDKPTILIVDDDELMRSLIGEAISDCYQVLSAASGEECLQVAALKRPDLILLDVEMPGLDGYETCHRLKADSDLGSIPVIFVSAHDEIEARIHGYEAGADDYIVKPLEMRELRAKISGLLSRVSERTQLKEMASYASKTAMTAMCSMSEIGSLLQTMQAFNACNSYPALVDAALQGLAAYGLDGVVQVRSPGGAVTRSTHGDANPLEASVIGHMADMERILQYRNRLSITYPSVSLLVSNLPTEDPDRCGRLRDHLAVLVESAEVRAASLIADAQTRLRGERIAASVQQITKVLHDIDQDQRRSRAATSQAIQDMTTKLERAYIQLALTEKQEEFFAGITSESVTRVLDAQLAETGQQDKMTTVIGELQKMLSL